MLNASLSEKIVAEIDETEIHNWQLKVEEVFAARSNLGKAELEEYKSAIFCGLKALDCGEIRGAECVDGKWKVNELVNKVILLSFMYLNNEVSQANYFQAKSFDKLPLKFENWNDEGFRKSAFRVVPGAVVRYGAYIGKSAVLMPCFINIGAYVGEGTMIDTWATVGSCAQVGARCHISGGVGLGGVLEPLGERPVIIEDDVFIGARSEIAEGVKIGAGAVLGMGVFISQSTPIIDRATGEVFYGEVPPNAVVIPGTRQDATLPNITTSAAIIVKYADEKTRGKTALNLAVREL